MHAQCILFIQDVLLNAMATILHNVYQIYPMVEVLQSTSSPKTHQ